MRGNARTLNQSRLRNTFHEFNPSKFRGSPEKNCLNLPAASAAFTRLGPQIPTSSPFSVKKTGMDVQKNRTAKYSE
jgi:hypothetical protein